MFKIPPLICMDGWTDGRIGMLVDWLDLGFALLMERHHFSVSNVCSVCLLICLSKWFRLVKSESSDSLCSQSSGSSGTHPAIRSLRQQPSRSQSTSSTSSSAARRTTSGKIKQPNLKWKSNSRFTLGVSYGGVCWELHEVNKLCVPARMMKVQVAPP